MRGVSASSPSASPGADLLPRKDQRGAIVSLCLQKTPELSVTVADLGLEPQRVCSDRPMPDTVMSALVVSYHGSGLFVPKPTRDAMYHHSYSR
jgi:hypothetical protein